MNINKKMICFDTQSCIKCFACIVNCGAENRIRLQRNKNIPIEETFNESLSYLNHIKIETKEIGSYPNIKNIIAYNYCRHCEKPNCVDICPTKALNKEDNGIVSLNHDICVGCQACKDACPYDVPVFSKETGKTYKCFMCSDRQNIDLPTACVEACPSVALFSGNEEKVLKEAKKRAENYSKIFKKEFIVYGDGSENLTVGKLGFITIAPKEDRELYNLPENTNKPLFKAREIIKVGTVIGAGLTAAAIGVHIKHWQKNKPNSMYNKEER